MKNSMKTYTVILNSDLYIGNIFNKDQIAEEGSFSMLLRKK